MAKEDLLSIIPIVGKQLNKKNEETEKSASKVNQKSLESEMPFDKVIGSIICIDKGRYRTIARTNAISIDDMDKEDQNNIIDGYSEWLNGITKPFQIYIPSFNLDIRDNINRLQERLEDEDNDMVCDWLEDDMNLQKELVEENDIIDTQFYLVFEEQFKSTGDPYKDYLKAKKELSKAVKFASDELEGIGLNLVQLKYDDIGKLLYYGLNPFSAGIQEPYFEENLIIHSEQIENKRKKEIKEIIPEELEEKKFTLSNKETTHLKDGGLTFKQKITPYSTDDSDPDYIRCGDAYICIYEIFDYPVYMPRLWAKKLYKYRRNMDLSMHICPKKTSEVYKELDRASINYGSSMIDERTGETRKANTMLEKKMISTSKDIDKFMDLLGSGESAFHFSFYISVKSKDREELRDMCDELENIIGSINVEFRKTTGNMKNGLWSVIPLGLNLLGAERNMLTSGVANSLPFTNFSFTHKNGFFLATHKYNTSFVCFNPYNLDNANGGILGASGGGKSVTVKKIAKGLTTVLNVPIRIIDPEGENIPFAKSIGGEVIDYFVGSDHKINILEPEPDDEMKSLIKPQINFVKIFLGKILGDLSKEDRAVIDASLIYLYNKFGFTDDKDTYYDDSRKDEGIFAIGRPKRIPPTLYDLYLLWDSDELKGITEYNTKPLANLLREWTRLGSNDLFDGHTNVDFKNPRLFFNLKHMDKAIKGPGIFVLMQKLWDLSRKNPLEYKAIVMEESHVLFRDDEMGEYVYDINKRIRKYGGSCIYVTQDITDFLKTKWGPEIIKNCSWSILMKQDRGNVDELQERYQMTRSEAMKMTRFNPRKGEAYLVADKFRIPINIRISKKEDRTFTTKTADLIAMQKELQIG